MINDLLKKFFNIPAYLIFILILAAILYSYYGLWNTFFIADEWNILNSQILIPDYGVGYFFQLFSMPYGIHFVPFGIVFLSLQTYLFGISVQGYTITSILLHYINCLIIFFIVRNYTKRRYVAFFASLFFATNFQMWEGVFWFSINPWIQISTALVLTGAYLLIRFVQTKKLRFYIWSLILANLALYFLEYSFMILLVDVIAFLYVMVKNRIQARNFIYALFSSIFSISFYIFLRAFVVKASSSQILKLPDLMAAKTHFAVLYLWSILTFPSRILSNVLVPEQTMLTVSAIISKYVYYSLPLTQSDVFTTVLFYDQLNIFVGSIVLLILFFLFLMINKKSIIKSCLTIFGLSFLMLPIVYLSIGEYRYWIFSRYLYMPYAIFTVFVFVLIAQFKLFKKWNYASVMIFVVLVGYIGFNAFSLNRFIASFVESGQQRKQIVQYISDRLDFSNKYQIVYVLNKNTVTGNVDALPFQSNPGKVILIWSNYSVNNKKYIPLCLEDPLFLYDQHNEYKYCDGKGYGYFQNFSQLKNLVRTKGINPVYVKSFYYNDATGKVVDISQQVIKQLGE